MEEENALQALSALSNATRMQLFKALVSAAPNGLTAGELAGKVDASPSRASFHLSNLEAAGLVNSEKRAREITYTARFDTMTALTRFILEDCCSGQINIRDCC